MFSKTGICAQVGQQQVMDEPKGITHRALIRTPAASNKAIKARIKDIAQFSGVRNNQLIGYGLVVGLNGTGDTLSSSPYTKESLTGMLERLGVNIRDNAIPSGKNVAAVMVTANLPPFAKQGTSLDVTVSAMGDAKDLRGGMLLVTPLLAADGEVYAVAQGSLIVSGLAIQGKAATNTSGIPTSGKIVSGAIVEKEVSFTLSSFAKQTLSLRNPDLTTAKRVSIAINQHFKKQIATATDNANIEIIMPMGFELINFMTEVEQLEVEPDQTAKVIIDPNGVIVIGHNVRISPVALTHGSVTIRVVEAPHVSQPNPFTQVTASQAISQANQTATNNGQLLPGNTANLAQHMVTLQDAHEKAIKDLREYHDKHIDYLKNNGQQTLVSNFDALYNQQEQVLKQLHAQQMVGNVQPLPTLPSPYSRQQLPTTQN
jgi:flagellar P-ring protein precursor FlgI